jgi:putative oxidoreductase
MHKVYFVPLRVLWAFVVQKKQFPFANFLLLSANLFHLLSKASFFIFIGRNEKSNRMKRSTVIEIIAALFILLFVYTATSKFFEFASFKYVLSKSPLIGNMAPAVAWGLPIVELLISLLLFIPRTRRLGLWASFGIMVLFTGYLGYMIYFTPDRPCSCGGVLKQMTWKQHLVFNIGFTLLALLGLWLQRRQHRMQAKNNDQVQHAVFT